MRATTGGLLLVVLITAAIVLLLQGRAADEDLRAVRTVAADLREAGVEGRPFDRAAAVEAIEALEQLVSSPTLIEHHVDDLREIAAAAAAWADAAPTPSAELSISVALRSAAAELRTYAASGSERSLEAARQRLAAARQGLTGEGPAGVAGAPSGVRDRLENLQRSNQERLQEFDENLQQ